MDVSSYGNMNYFELQTIERVAHNRLGALKRQAAHVRSAALHHYTTATKKGTNDRPTQSSCAEQLMYPNSTWTRY
jgi:hypothetical protein